MGRRFPRRGIHDELDLSIDDPVFDVRLAFIDLVDPFHGDARRFDQLRGPCRGNDLEAVFIECPGHCHRFVLVPVADGQQHGTLQGQQRLGGFLGFEIRFAYGLRQAQHLAGRTHFRPQDRIHFREHVEGEHRFFYAVVWNLLFFQARYRRRAASQLAGNDIRGQWHHTDAAHLGYQRHGTGCPGIGLQHIHLAVFDGVLHVHEAYYVHLHRDLAGIFFNGLQVFFRDLPAGQDAGTVAGVDAGQFDMFHDCRNKSVLAVGDGVRFTFQRIVQEPVDEDGPVRGYADGRRHVVLHLVVVMNHFHAPAA